MTKYLPKIENNQVSPLEDIQGHRRLVDSILPSNRQPDWSHAYFPDSDYLSDCIQTSSSKHLFPFRFDNAYYLPLRKIDWHVFLTLKFRNQNFYSISDSAFWRRKQYLWDLVHEVVGERDFSTNELQYFCTEEIKGTKSDAAAHLHVLFHRVYPEKCSIESLRRSIERNIDPKLIHVPKANQGSEPPHVQTVRSQDRAIRYLLKKPLFQEEPKTFHFSHKFVRFWNRHQNWKSRQAA